MGGDALEHRAPLELQPADPRARGVGAAGPRHLLACEGPLAERVIEGHRPPEAEVPGRPCDARRAEVVSLVLGPLGAPLSVGRLIHVQALLRWTPEAFLGRESVEVVRGELPGNLELAEQVVAELFRHIRGSCFYEVVSAGRY